MLISAQALLNRNATPDKEEIREAISSNLCRCTGYQQICDAIKMAADRTNGTYVAKEH
jgi:carbon-monoxide dehydrogenase small subunit